MKPLKSEDNIVSNVKKPSENRPIFRAIYFIRNTKAFSLIEVMVTTMIGAIVSMGIASVFIFAMEQFTILVEQNTAEENSLMVTYYLRNYLSQSVEVFAVEAVDPFAIPALSGGGQLDYNFDLLFPLQSEIVGADDGNFTRFAIFNREAGTYNTGSGTMPNGGSVMTPTGIFVKDTDVDGINPDVQSGAVIFDINSATGTMLPGPSDLVFTRLHNMRVQRIPAGAANCPGGFAVEVVVDAVVATNPRNGMLLNCMTAAWPPAAAENYKIKTITLEVMMRYFRSSSKSEWNYRAPIGGAATAPYIDIVQTVKINFKNNLLTRESLTGAAGAEERVHGSLYFYDYILPSTRF